MAIPPPTTAIQPIEVKVSYGARLGCSLVPAVVLTLFSAWGLYQWLSWVPPPQFPDTPREPPLVLIPFAGLALVFAVIALMLLSERRRTPRRFDAQGVTLRNGTLLPWRDFRGVHAITEYNRRSLHRFDVGVELRFERGTAVVVYRAITNPGEVLWITSELTAGRNPYIDVHFG